MKRFFIKFTSVKFWCAVYLLYLLWVELHKDKPDSVIAGLLVAAALLALGIREYTKLKTEITGGLNK